MKEKGKPICQLSGTDGNVFFLASKVSRALKDAGQYDKEVEFSEKLKKCVSYSEAIALMFEYVRVR